MPLKIGRQRAGGQLLTQFLPHPAKWRQSAWCNPDQFSLSIQDNSRRRVLDGKRILLIVGGGIAAYKSLELIRLLAREGIGARVILTKAGAEFVTPLSPGTPQRDRPSATARYAPSRLRR